MKARILRTLKSSSGRTKSGISSRLIIQAIAVLALVALASGCGVFGNRPSGTVESFIGAVKAKSYGEAVELVSPSLRDQMRGVVSEFTTGGNSWASSSYKVKETRENGDNATVTIEFVDGGASNGKPVAFGSRHELRFFLIKEQGTWYIEGLSE